MLLNCGVGGDSWESLGQQGDKPVNPKGNQSWIFIGRTDAEAEAPILWPPDLKNWLTGKDPDAGKDWGQEEKGTTEDEMVGWHQRLNRHAFEQTLGVGDGQEGLVCCSPWGRKVEPDWVTELNCWKKLNNNEQIAPMFYGKERLFSYEDRFVLKWTKGGQDRLKKHFFPEVLEH